MVRRGEKLLCINEETRLLGLKHLKEKQNVIQSILIPMINNYSCFKVLHIDAISEQQFGVKSKQSQVSGKL